MSGQLFQLLVPQFDPVIHVAATGRWPFSRLRLCPLCQGVPHQADFFHRPTRCVLLAYTSPRPPTVSGSEKKTEPGFELRSQNMNILSGVGRTWLSTSCSLTKGLLGLDLSLQLDQILIHVVCVNPPLVQTCCTLITLFQTQW